MITTNSLQITHLTEDEKIELKDLVWEIYEEHFKFDSWAIILPYPSFLGPLESPNYIMNVIHKKDSDYRKEIIGFSDIIILTKDSPIVINTAKIGMLIKRKYRGQGIGTFVLKKTIEQCKDMGIEFISTLTSKNNIASKKMLEKLNFTFMGSREKFIKEKSGLTMVEYYDLDLRT